jgi:hypothetical protein
VIAVASALLTIPISVPVSERALPLKASFAALVAISYSPDDTNILILACCIK